MPGFNPQSRSDATIVSHLSASHTRLIMEKRLKLKQQMSEVEAQIHAPCSAKIARLQASVIELEDKIDRIKGLAHQFIIEHKEGQRLEISRQGVTYIQLNKAASRILEALNILDSHISTGATS